LFDPPPKCETVRQQTIHGSRNAKEGTRRTKETKERIGKRGSPLAAILGYRVLMPSEPIREVTVLGAGVMGAAIAAHLANAGLRVRLLDIPAKDAPAGDKAARNKIAAAGLEGARKAKPAAFFSPRFDTLVTVGNLEDDLASAVAASDVVIEAIIENLAIKQALYARIDEMGGRAIITSNTSGLRIADLMQGRSADFRGRF